MALCDSRDSLPWAGHPAIRCGSRPTPARHTAGARARSRMRHLSAAPWLPVPGPRPAGRQGATSAALTRMMKQPSASLEQPAVVTFVTKPGYEELEPTAKLFPARCSNPISDADQHRSAGRRMHAGGTSQYPPCEWGTTHTLWRLSASSNTPIDPGCGKPVNLAACPVHNVGITLWTVSVVSFAQPSDMRGWCDTPVSSNIFDGDFGWGKLLAGGAHVGVKR